MAIHVSRQLTFEQALSRAASLCSTSEHCIADISEKLVRWGIVQADADKIIDRLIDEKYIDEARYATAYTRDKVRFSHWGKVKIGMMLRMQHIPEKSIRAAFEDLDPKEYAEIAQQVVMSKAKDMDINDYTSRAKVIRFALQRGFEMEDIEKILG